MKSFSILILSVFFSNCNSNKGLKSPDAIRKDTVVVHDTVILYKPARNWQENFGLTHNPDEDSAWYKPVSYYLDDPACSGLAYDYYYGLLSPGDNGTTDELLKLAVTDNQKLRPFYRWCLNMTIIIQDGALTEHTGIPARKYVEKFPKEFFSYIDSDTSKWRYEDWVNSISYSGFYYGDDYRKPEAIAFRLASTMKANCKDCSERILLRINKFAKDCFN